LRNIFKQGRWVLLSLSALLDFVMSPSRWIVNTDVSFSEIGDELALLQPTSGRYFTLNQTGASVWHLLHAPLTTSEVAVAIAEKYGIPMPECQDDITEVIARLSTAGLVQKA
jgi:hypothetical protein